MIFFGDDQNKSLSEGLAAGLSTPLYYPQINVFSDGERRIRINENVVDEHVVFLKTSSKSSNFDSLILETAFLIDAFKRSGASQITLIQPYLPYSRADHVFRDGEAVPLEVMINLYEKSGLTKIVYVDPHTIKIPEMFSIENNDLSALSLFAGKIKEIGFDPNNAVIISPDMGGLRRMMQLSEMLGNLPYASIEKDRDYENGQIKADAIHGEIKRTCFVIDDMISTGATIVQAVEKLVEAGAVEIYVFATHPILAGDASQILQTSKAINVFVTDALPIQGDKKFEKLEVLSLANLISSSF